MENNKRIQTEAYFKKIELTKGRCEICNKRGFRECSRNNFHIHHRDCNPENNDISNLVLLCPKCHGFLHKGRRNKTSKFVRLYGKTALDLGEQFGCDMSIIYKWHKKNKLNTMLDLSKKT